MSWTLGWTKQGSSLLCAPEEIPCQQERIKTRFQGTVPRMGNQAVYQSFKQQKCRPHRYRDQSRENEDGTKYNMKGESSGRNLNTTCTL